MTMYNAIAKILDKNAKDIEFIHGDLGLVHTLQLMSFMDIRNQMYF